MMDSRGRLTPVDIVYTAAGLAALAFLGAPLYTLLDSSSLDPGTELIFRMLVPAMVAMLIYTVYQRSLLGGG